MPTVAVRGVVLRRWDAGESDRRVALFSRELGKIYAVARGARKANARLAAASEPLCYADFGLAVGTKNRYITEAQPLAGFGKLRDDYQRLLCALSLCEIIDAVMPEGEASGETFDLLLTALAGIQRGIPLAALCWADLKIMEIAGYQPVFDASAASGKPLGASASHLSPSAGGALLREEAESYRDSKPISGRALEALRSLQRCDEPPERLFAAGEAAEAIGRLWREFADRELPARKRLLLEISKVESE